MLKTGFRGERKGILSPFTYSPIRRLLPRRGGVVTSRERRKSGNVGTGQEAVWSVKRALKYLLLVVSYYLFYIFAP